MKQYLRTLGAVLLAALMTACGGGGGSAGVTTGTGGSTDNSPATIEVFTSAPQLSSSPNSSVTFTVVAKDASNQAIPNQTVTFSASSGNLQGALPAPHTGAAGEAITGVSLSPGADPTARNIVVTLTAGGVSKTVTIPVVGTTLSMSGDSSLLLGGVTTYTAKVVDSSGTAIPGASLTVVSSLGNTISPSTITSDAQGAATFQYTATRSGVDTLTLSGLGTTAQTSVSVSADDFRFESPASATSVVVGGTQTVTIRFLTNGIGASGQTVTFSTTRGTISPPSGTTDVNGRASAVVTSTTSGPATVIAQVGSAQSTLPLTFIATTPATLVLQANPGTVAPNTGSSSTVNRATLQAVVRDASGNPVSGRVVNFSAITDGSNGTISPGSGTTDSNGAVVAQFIPGPLTTASNGVLIRATVQGTSISGDASLTVSGQALFISIATSNEINNLDPTTYKKDFSVYVTDAQGAPVSRVVDLSVFPDTYLKGTLHKPFLNQPWMYNGTPTACPNEDVINKDGILQAGEDTNGDGRLTPGLPVVVAPASVTTAANGFATFSLTYGENFAPWLIVSITARASVGGTESVQSQVYNVLGSASDFNSPNPPAGHISPFGTVASYSSPF
jgi:hypothetical protein